MKIVLAAAAAATALIAAPAFAQDAPGPVFTDVGFYANLGALRLDGEGADLNGAVLRGGARLNRFVGAEAELSIGVGGDDVEFEGEDFEVKLDHQFAAYVVGFVPVSPNMEVFGRLGVGMLEASVEDFASDDVQTWNYGVGAQFFFDGVNGVRADFTRMEVFDDEEFEDGGFNVWSIAYVRKFGG